MIATLMAILVTISGCAIPPPEQEVIVLDQFLDEPMELPDLESRLTEKFIVTFGLWANDFLEAGDGTFRETNIIWTMIKNYPGMTEEEADIIFNRVFDTAFNKFDVKDKIAIVIRLEILKAVSEKYK